MKVLLAYPRFPVTYWGFQYGLKLIGKRASLPPLGLLTVAALLPKHWQIRVIDLNVDVLLDADLRWADVIMTGGLLIQTDSILEIVARARSAGRAVAVGGPAPTASPELFGDATVIFQGEAEGRIDQLVHALTEQSTGNRAVLSAPSTYPDMENVPTPRFDLIDLSKYASLSIQYSRGCPYQCEFCDVIEIFGRKPRVKTPKQIISELDEVYRLGYRGTLFFVDDNFIGNKAEVKRLLPALQNWQRARGYPFEFYTEASVDLAADQSLLNAVVEAGFSSVFLGIETPSLKALAQSKKLQNLRLNLSEAVDRITRAGLEVMGGFILGFDSDDSDIFRAQREFLDGQPIPLAMMGMLTALPGTALWRRLAAEGRLRQRASGDQFVRPNFVPVMDEQTLLRGYIELIKWLYSAKAYYNRCEAFLKRAGSMSNSRASTSNEVGAFVRALWHIGVLSPRRRHFWQLLAKAITKGRVRVRDAVVHAVKGEHLILFTREHVVPRMERALVDIQSRVEQSAAPYALSSAGIK